MEPSISRRTFRIGRAPQRWFHHALFLSGGQAYLSGDSDAPAIAGPAIVFFPPSESETIILAAGAHGSLVGVSPEILAEATGDHAESSALRLFAGNLSISEFLASETVREIAPLFAGFLGEMQRETRASRMVIAAYARLILMASFRLADVSQQAGEAPASAGAILQRFRQAVELSFRLHRSISDYASELGISPDRLHDICRRSLDRSPLELVHDRLVQEARLRLERSARSIQEISDGLGFRDPANFSHFFKRKTGVSPARYRALAQSSPDQTTIPLASSYHDWP
jgi:AraC-like DNA-binding protein